MNQEPSQEAIPDKLYFRIGEVSKLLGIEPHVLRFWETEFPALSPKKSDTGHRLFRRKDVELLFRIKHLLYNEAIHNRRCAASLHQKRVPNLQQNLFAPDPLPHIREELAALLDLLSS